MAFYSGVIPSTQSQILGSKNIPFAQTVSTGRQIVEGASGALALQTTAIDINSKLNKLEIMDYRLGQLVVNSDTTESFVEQLFGNSNTTNTLLTTANTFNNASAVNSGVISANTGTTATNTATTATNTANTNTTLATTNTTLTTANNLAILTNWLLQPAITTPSIFAGNSGVGTYTSFTGPYDLYLASPVAPFTPVLYYNSITIQGIITAVSNIANPTLCFQFSYNNSTWFAENIYPRTGSTAAGTSTFTLQRTDIPYRYVRVSTLGQNITFSNFVVSLQHIP